MQRLITLTGLALDRIVEIGPAALDDIGNTTKRFEVRVNGTWLSQAEIDEKLALTGARP